MRARRAQRDPTGQASEATRPGPECSRFPLHVVSAAHGLRVRPRARSARSPYRQSDAPRSSAGHDPPLFVAGNGHGPLARTEGTVFGLVAASEDRPDPSGETPSGRSFVATVHLTHREHQINKRGRHKDPLKRRRTGRFPQAPKGTLETVENVQAPRQTEGTLRARNLPGSSVVFGRLGRWWRGVTASCRGEPPARRRLGAALCRMGRGP